MGLSRHQILSVSDLPSLVPLIEILLATPTIAGRNGLISNSPFGDASSTIYGGRPSDAFSCSLGSNS